MIKKWGPVVESEYKVLVHGQMQAGFRGLILLAAILFPAFAPLDILTQGHKLWELLAIRFATSAFYIFVYAFLGRPFLKDRPYSMALVALSIASLSITAMCMVLGGHESPYYAGVNLVILAGVLMLPVDARKMGLAVSLIISVYVLGFLIQSGLQIDSPLALINNLYFMIATGVIGITASFFNENMRRESFDRYIEMVRAQNHLKRSKELLQEELHSEQGNVEALVKEITQKKSTLEDALSLRNEFISLASHELNTPLTSLSLQTEMCKRKFAEEGTDDRVDTRKLVNAYEVQLKRLIRIVSDMLDVSRIARGKLIIDRSEVDLVKLVAGVIEQVAPKFEIEGTPLTMTSTVPVIGMWDQFRIEQVMLNLLMNALKYGAGNPVEVHVEKSQEHAILNLAQPTSFCLDAWP